MATADLIAAADHTSKPSVTKDSWSPHLLAGAYAHGAPERDLPAEPPTVMWWGNRWLHSWEWPIHEAALRQERERDARVIRGCMAGES